MIVENKKLKHLSVLSELNYLIDNNIKTKYRVVNKMLNETVIIDCVYVEINEDLKIYKFCIDLDNVVAIFPIDNYAVIKGVKVNKNIMPPMI